MNLLVVILNHFKDSVNESTVSDVICCFYSVYMFLVYRRATDAVTIVCASTVYVY